MRRRSPVLASAFLFCALGEPGCASVPTEATPEAVIRGTREMGYPEVIAVYWQNPSPTATGGGLCTGTIIGPHAVLTAKHCVYDGPDGGPHTAVPASWFYLIEGHDIMGGGPVHRVSEVRSPPGTDIDSDVSNGYDIAILLTPSTLVPTPRPYATRPPAVSSAATVVGFGRTQTGTPMPTDSGLKYSGSMTIRQVGMRQILANGSSWTCQGDSGGPLIDSAGAVTGITSFGFDGSCRNANSVFTSVSGFTTLIADALTWAPPCMPQHEICNGLDDDCNGTPDDGLGCAPLGAACAMDSECASTQCGMAGGAMVCTRGCFPDTMIDPCPTGTHCEVHACGDGVCAPGAPGSGAPGDTCTADTDCATGYCAVLQGRRLCGRQCWPVGGSGCSADLVCNLGNASDPTQECGACLPAAQAMGPRGLGEACTTDVECVTEHCATTGHFCTEMCAMQSDCPSGWHCNGAFCSPGPLGMLGAPCSTAGDCASSAPECVEAECSIPCTMGTTDCGLGFACYDTTLGAHCLTEGAGLGGPCATNDECRSGLCLSTNECTQLCDVSACPSGYHCADLGGTEACLEGDPAGPPPTSNCGCTTQSPRSAPNAIGLLAGIALVLTRRRLTRR